MQYFDLQYQEAIDDDVTRLIFASCQIAAKNNSNFNPLNVG